MSRRHGYTLVEIMVVIVIIALLIAILFPVITSAQQQAKSAVCMGNLHQIGTAITQYRQDYGRYPTPDKPMEILVLSGKLAAKITCVNDPKNNNDTYQELYNYWGYDDSGNLTPLPLTQALAAGVYGNLQLQVNQQNKGEWSTGVSYVPFDNVKVTVKNSNNEITSVQYYLCYTATNQIQPGAPGVPWKTYWKPMASKWWKISKDSQGNPIIGNAPDSDFPGLVNPNCLGTTIVTACPHHTENNHKYPILRVDGSSANTPPMLGMQTPNQQMHTSQTIYDDICLKVPGDLFWTLSLKTGQ